MKLKAFRVKNFKSIIDSGLTHLSVDYITTVIGQNESGKSALIEALDSYFKGVILEKDIRHDDGDLPSVDCVYATSEAEIRTILDEYQLPEAVVQALRANSWEFTLQRTWVTDLAKGELSLILPSLTDDDFTYSESESEQEKETPSPEEPDLPPEPKKKQLTVKAMTDLLFENVPIIIFFDKQEHILPATIDIKSLNTSKSVKGKAAALNFLKLVGLDDLTYFNDRKNRAKIQHKIEKEAIKFTKDFQVFWQQEIGASITGSQNVKGEKVEIKFGVDAHDGGEEAGTGSYLYFIVGDGKQLLHPDQRSDGMRWYISFYLQLRAYSQNGERPQVIVMDEPGQFLHASAQEDLLKLFEAEANENVNIIYTTHSPFMVGQGDKINRIIAAQRSPHKKNDGYSHTEIMSGFELGAASRNTLFPLMAHMGMRLSDQEVIKRENNLITEEISATYYIKAFLLLNGKDIDVNIIASTGADNVPQLCYEFLGWGLKFSVLLDGDKKGEKVRNNLKRDLFLDDDEIANKNVYRMRGHNGIEDIFTQKDFKKHVLGDESVSYTGDNSKYVDEQKLPKAVLAAIFLQKVKEGHIAIEGDDGLMPTTKTNIQKVVNAVEKLISNQASRSE
ncbi:MAG: AAA family ATPase [Candidatus Saccharibacteria bacterium]|nr:AAA family ATPase [Candidatus Saccharibacteria bacterium]